MHGYQLKKRLSDTLGPFWQVSYGSLYPALKRLQREGAVEVVFPKQEVVRRRNVYRITRAGQRSFAELVEDGVGDRDDDNGFRVRFAFFRHLKPETRIGLLERRRAHLLDRLADLKSRLRSYREKVDAYTLSLMRHGMDSTQNDIDWLDDMIQRERRAARRRSRSSAAKKGASS